MKKREIPFMAQYENEFGYHEWTTLDSANNLVRCYYNGDTELHVKEPWCECNGVRMRKVRHFYRFCKFFSHFFWQYQLLAVTLFSNYEF